MELAENWKLFREGLAGQSSLGVILPNKTSVKFCIAKTNLRILRLVNRNYRRRNLYMKATGIVRRIDDLGRVVIPKEIRRTLRIREGDPSRTTLEPWERFCFGMMGLEKRMGWSGT